MDRFVCIHGHFYQPPRENPWLEFIETQDSAYPYHDWNDRVTAECYAPNTASRILDGEGRIERIVNNYARISFNIGPTVLAWLESHAQDVYGAILEADRESRRRFGGHGSALAQPYNHMILPLANRRDKVTQVRWGLRDFEHRYRRRPEGMWLPETAVDVETLEVLAEHGLRFTILSQHQAARVRKIGESSWGEPLNGGIDPTTAYSITLPSGRRMALFFYDGPVSRAVAFERLLTRGEDFAHRLLGAFSERREWPQLVHVATDGETYGHHHRHGDMALAYALHYIEQNRLARLTNYGEFLEKHPPAHEVQIVEGTSWSCVHGVQRWRADCGCNSGGRPGWSQAWRGPLRESLDRLRDGAAPLFEKEARGLVVDPWAARDDYISLVLDRSAQSEERFFARHAAHPLSEDERVRALKLLELQRHAQLMYTSCGWFFDDISGIESVQVLQYAGRVLQLAREFLAAEMERPFLDLLERAKSNLPEHRDGRVIYEKFVRPSVLDLGRVGAHYAMSAIFDHYGERTDVYAYAVNREDVRLQTAGRATLGIGRARVSSKITHESARCQFVVLYSGDQNMVAGVRPFVDEAAYEKIAAEVTEAFGRGDLAEVRRRLEDRLGPGTYSLRFLFRDEQRNILRQILKSAMDEAEGLYRQLTEHHEPLLRFLHVEHMPVPRAFQAAAEFVLNRGLKRVLEADEPNLPRLKALLEAVQLDGVELDREGLGYTLKQTILRAIEALRPQAANLELLRRLKVLVDLAVDLPFEIDLWRAQNVIYERIRARGPELARAEGRDPAARAELELLEGLAGKLKLRPISQPARAGV
ncbi:MAG: DUF3536 domain-containing protein [Planctomycetes bacterium]|nr:DUF3536 domain-containing protein [Planctomycetota bacterium]